MYKNEEKIPRRPVRESAYRITVAAASFTTILSPPDPLAPKPFARYTILIVRLCSSPGWPRQFNGHANVLCYVNNYF